MDNWDLTRLYKDTDEFETEFSYIKALIPQFSAYKGKLKEEKELESFLKLDNVMEEKLAKLFIYASMKSDLNKKDVGNSKTFARCQQLVNDVTEATSWESPEVLSLGEEYMNSFLDKHADLEAFRFRFQKLFRTNEHVLDDKSEKLLAAYNQLSGEGSSLYSALSVGDAVSKDILLADGKKLTVTQGNWRNLISDAKSEEERFKIFEAVFSYYEQHKNTYGEIYNTIVQSELAEMKARNYSSILELHLFNNNIPLTVYRTLIEVAGGHTESLKKYYEIRRKYLGLEYHHSYDRFIQLSHSDKKYSYEEAKNLFFASVEKFPDDFKKKAHEVLVEGYVDVYEKEGKRSGAYSSGGSGIHPYILFNFDGALDDCFTVAHESGHSIHTLYTMENQPLILQDYTIFVAEIASTFNEHNLLDYLLNLGKTSKAEKIMLLQKSIDDIISTFYRQTLFAEYELDISVMAEKGEPINYDACNKEMIKLYSKYYGIDIALEKVKSYVWAYIPHLFYYPFYVYQYATSFSASMKIYQDVKNKKPQAFDKYIGLLKAGGSKYPVEEAKEAGVDFTDPETFMAVVHRFDELVDELDKVLNG